MGIPATVGQQVSVVPLTAQRPSYASHARQMRKVGMKDNSRLGRKQVVGQSTKYKLCRWTLVDLLSCL